PALALKNRGTQIQILDESTPALALKNRGTQIQILDESTPALALKTEGLKSRFWMNRPRPLL
ncbi:MAG: hypothetical protein AAFP83_20730, partial [Bacteroidota bacterium]